MKYYVIGIALLVLLTACSEKQDANVLQQLPLDLQAGKALVEMHCVTCHGLDGRGTQNNIPNLAAQHETYLLKVFQSYDHGQRTRNGGELMEVAEELKPGEIRNAVGYYASLPPLKNLGAGSARYSYYDRGKSLVKACASCHGDDGNPSETGLPRLAGQHPEYLINAMMAYQDGSRHMPTMHTLLQGLSQADLDNIGLYFALQTPKPPPSTADNPYEGKQFTYNCTECHGSKGSSRDAAIPNLAGQDASYLNTMLKAYRDEVREHDQMHDLIGELKDSEIDKIAVFFASEKAQPPRFMQPEEIYTLARKCARCHAAENSNPDMLAPKLAGQNRAYLINALTLYRDGERGSSAMHRMSSVYSDATIEGIATYYSAQEAK